MSDQLPRNPDEPGIERVERVEYIERVPGGQEPAPPARQSSPMWLWVLPLVLVAIALIWYVLSRGGAGFPGRDHHAGQDLRGRGRTRQLATTE